MELQNLLNLFFNFSSRPDIDYADRDIEKSFITDKKVKTLSSKKTSNNETKFKADITNLEKKFGPLKDKYINITLSELLTIVPKHRKRIDAYNALTSYLRKAFNATLFITSRKTRNSNTLL